MNMAFLVFNPTKSLLRFPEEKETESREAKTMLTLSARESSFSSHLHQLYMTRLKWHTSDFLIEHDTGLIFFFFFPELCGCKCLIFSNQTWATFVSGPRSGTYLTCGHATWIRTVRLGFMCFFFFPCRCTYCITVSVSVQYQQWLYPAWKCGNWWLGWLFGEINQAKRPGTETEWCSTNRCARVGHFRGQMGSHLRLWTWLINELTMIQQVQSKTMKLVMSINLKNIMS